MGSICTLIELISYASFLKAITESEQHFPGLWPEDDEHSEAESEERDNLREKEKPGIRPIFFLKGSFLVGYLPFFHRFY